MFCASSPRIVTRHGCRLAAAALSLLALVSCATPTPPPASFVTQKELLAAELSNQALNEFQNGRYLDADMGFRQVLYLFPDSQSGKFNFANSILELGLYDEAESIFRELEERDPDEPKYKTALANLYYKAGRYQEALDQYGKISGFAREKEMTDLEYDSIRSISVIHFLLGYETQALCESAQTLEKKSRRDDLVHHGRLLAGMNRIAEADFHLSSVLTAPEHQKDAYLLHLFALVLFADGRFDDAFLTNKRAVLYSHGKGDLAYEIKLMKVLLYDRTELLRKEFDDDDEDERERKEEERLKVRGEVLGDRRLEGKSTLYWPSKFEEAVFDAASKYREEKEAEKAGSLFYRVKQIIPWG